MSLIIGTPLQNILLYYTHLALFSPSMNNKNDTLYGSTYYLGINLRDKNSIHNILRFK